MNQFIATAALALAISLISSCADPRVDLARMESIEVKSDEAKYRGQARRFIRLAQVGDLNRLIRLTSPLTLISHGRHKVLENYENELIPTFRNRNIPRSGRWPIRNPTQQDRKCACRPASDTTPLGLDIPIGPHPRGQSS